MLVFSNKSDDHDDRDNYTRTAAFCLQEEKKNTRHKKKDRKVRTPLPLRKKKRNKKMGPPADDWTPGPP